MDRAGVEIRIEVLSVEGMSRGETPRFQQEVERELARLVVERGVPSGLSASGAIGTLEADMVPDGDTAVPLACRVADAVYGAMDR